MSEVIRAEAKVIEMKGKAEAEAVAAKAKSMTSLVVEFERTKSWNGQLPTAVMGDQSNLLMQMKN